MVHAVKRSGVLRNINPNNNEYNNANNYIYIYHYHGRIYYMSFWSVLERDGMRHKHKRNDKRGNEFMLIIPHVSPWIRMPLYVCRLFGKNNLL